MTDSLCSCAQEPPNRFVSLRADLAASFVVFLIAIPLSLGIALASGAPLMSGLIAAMVGGIVAGLLGGAPLQVSGPAAGLTVLTFGLVQQFGWPVTCCITVCAGIVQILLGGARVARVALTITPAVVHGMLAGIGIVIALAQLHVVLGGAAQSSALNNLQALPQQMIDHHGPAVILGFITMAILVAWPWMPKRLRSIPSALVAITASTIVSLVFEMPVKRIDLPAHLFDGHVFPQLPSDQWGGFAVAVISVALIASVESLLSAVATDKMHNGRRANLDRELLGQGSANLISGLLGGLPVSGVIVRSSANIQAGAKSRLAAILHGVWVMLFVTLLAFVIDDIPLASLAGLLVVVGLKLVKINDIRELANHRELPVYLVTLLSVVFINLLTGVLIGSAMAIATLLYRLASVTVRIRQKDLRWHVKVEGSLTSLSVPTLARALQQVPPGADVDLELVLDLLDHAAFESLYGWRETHQRMGGQVDIHEGDRGWYANAVSGTPNSTRTMTWTAFATLLTGRRPSAKAHKQDHVLEGVREFGRTGAEMLKPILARLARDGQDPATLFITCSDSRVVPTLLTLSGPGDLFTVRNVGNMVPHPLRSGDHSVFAAVDYALHALKIENIVVCGHSGCGAMHAILEGKHANEGHLGSWLGGGAESLRRFRRGESFAGTPMSETDELAQVNVIQQLDNLGAHAEVRLRVKHGKLRIFGMYLDLEQAQVLVYDEKTGVFGKVEDSESCSVRIEEPQLAGVA